MHFFRKWNPHLQFILASSSPIRQQLLSQLGLTFIVVKPDICEDRVKSDHDITSYVSRLSREKARKVAGIHPEALVIAADQACSLEDGDFIGKPGNFENALSELKRYQGHWLHFHTSVTLAFPAQNFCESETSLYSVRFANLHEADLKAYLLADTPWNCAGSFRLESRGLALFSEMRGEDYTGLLGLPLLALCRLLRKAGINPLSNLAS
jgi:MAF protein